MSLWFSILPFQQIVTAIDIIILEIINTSLIVTEFNQLKIGTDLQDPL